MIHATCFKKTGLASFELQLASEPPLGTWKIKLRTSDQEQTQTFEIEEYGKQYKIKQSSFCFNLHNRKKVD